MPSLTRAPCRRCRRLEHHTSEECVFLAWKSKETQAKYAMEYIGRKKKNKNAWYQFVHF